MLTRPIAVSMSSDEHKRPLMRADGIVIIDFVPHIFFFCCATTYHVVVSIERRERVNQKSHHKSMAKDVPIFRGDDAYRLRFNWQSCACVCEKRNCGTNVLRNLKWTSAWDSSQACCSFAQFQRTNWTSQVTAHTHTPTLWRTPKIASCDAITTNFNKILSFRSACHRFPFTSFCLGTIEWAKQIGVASAIPWEHNTGASRETFFLLIEILN